ncbi:ferredoxin--NADP reductase [Shewanella sp. YIC-542]|uniref:ferredoxin--NADP reductase n=1 Tax=Shewanella mytili TaxID=3377111 RepID=UPI00398EE480
MWREGHIVERIDWNERLFSLKIAVDIGPYVAGQFVKLSMPLAEKRIARAYSIINPPGGDYLEILAVKVQEGHLSPALHQLQVGDRIDVSAPATGFLTLDELPSGEVRGRHLWMLATGTAVGPFLAMLHTDAPWLRFENVVLVYSVKHRDDLAYLPQLQALAAMQSKFCFIPITTQDWDKEMLHCRIPDGLLSGEIEQRAGIPINAADAQVMLCGNPGMIRHTIALLSERGLRKNLRRAPGQITTEQYWS